MSFAHTQHDEKIQQTPEGWWVLKIDTHLSRWIEQAHRLDQEYRALEVLKPYIEQGSMVIDAGAALGDHTHFYLNEVGPSGEVVAFEPHPVQFECLKRNCPRATLYEKALGEESGIVYLFCNPTLVAASCLTTDLALGYKVERVILDEVLGDRKLRVSLLKIDVEGCEPQVLRGAKSILGIDKPAIWMEVNPEALTFQGRSVEELSDLLDEFHYEVRGSYGEANWGRCDILCVPK